MYTKFICTKYCISKKHTMLAKKKKELKLYKSACRERQIVCRFFNITVHLQKKQINRKIFIFHHSHSVQFQYFSNIMDYEFTFIKERTFFNRSLYG